MGPGWAGVREAESGLAFEVHSFCEAEFGHLRFQSGMELPDPQRELGGIEAVPSFVSSTPLQAAERTQACRMERPGELLPGAVGPTWH